MVILAIIFYKIRQVFVIVAMIMATLGIFKAATNVNVVPAPFKGVSLGELVKYTFHFLFNSPNRLEEFQSASCKSVDLASFWAFSSFSYHYNRR